MSKTQWYIGAQNGVVMCVNSVSDGDAAGIFYHGYSENGTDFCNLDQLVIRMEEFFDEINFPQRATNERSFTERKPDGGKMKKDKITDDDTLLSKHGDIGTFIIRVQHRQNSSWQGRITWMEEDKTICFRSIWEMIKLIENAVDTVSAPESEEDEPQWFGHGEKEENGEG